MSFESIVELRPHSNRLERWKLGEVKARETTFTVTTLFGRKNSFFEKKNIGPCAWNSVAEFQIERARREEDLGFKIQRSVFLFRISFFIFHFFEKGSPESRVYPFYGIIRGVAHFGKVTFTFPIPSPFLCDFYVKGFT